MHNIPLQNYSISVPVYFFTFVCVNTVAVDIIVHDALLLFLSNDFLELELLDLTPRELSEISIYTAKLLYRAVTTILFLLPVRASSLNPSQHMTLGFLFLSFPNWNLQSNVYF